MHHGTQAALASALLPLAAARNAPGPVASLPGNTLDLHERTIDELQGYLQSSQASRRDLCQWYLARIIELDAQGPTLRAVPGAKPRCPAPGQRTGLGAQSRPGMRPAARRSSAAVGLSFVGDAFSEAELLAIGYAYEQASRHRRALKFRARVG